MANDITIVNGVSKQNKGGNIVYWFDLCIVTAYTDATPSNEYYVLELNNGQQLNRVAWDDITDKLGAVNMEAYLDQCANNDYFKDTSLIEEYFLQYDGVNDSIQVTPATAISAYTAYTVFLGFYHTNPSAAQSLYAIANQGIDGNPDFMVGINADNTTLRVYNRTSSYVTYAGALIPNAMNYVAISRDLTSTQLVNINGTAFSSSDGSLRGNTNFTFTYNSLLGRSRVTQTEVTLLKDVALNATQLNDAVTAKTLVSAGNYAYKVIPAYPTYITSLNPSVGFLDAEEGRPVGINGKANPMVLGVDLVKL